MKMLLQILTVFVLINTTLVFFSEKAAAQSVSFQVFYDDLSPYGSWYESPEYGYVWRPSLSGFSPYSTNGYWVLTDFGWTWVSDYSWGWAPFHYGRWYNDPLYGYVWVPGYEWGPGWVTWRRSNDYYGWAPIGPGVSSSIAYSSGYNIPYNHWHFVRCNDFGRRDIHNYYIDRSKNVTIINNTTVINTTKVDDRRSTFNPGPDRIEVQKKVGRTINPVAIVDEKKPTQRLTKNNIQLYRPVVENKDVADRKPAPQKVTAINEVKEQATRAKAEKANETTNERRAKPVQVQPQVDRQPVDQPKAIQNNDRPDRAPQQPTEKKPVRDQPASTGKRPAVEQPDKPNAQPEKQQQPVHKQRDEQAPVQRQPERAQPTRQQQPQPERVQRKEQPSQQQPVHKQRDEKAPVQRQPERAQPTPQQQPQPERLQRNEQHRPQQQWEQQQPTQAPVQRPPVPQKERKG